MNQNVRLGAIAAAAAGAVLALAWVLRDRFAGPAPAATPDAPPLRAVPPPPPAPAEPDDLSDISGIGPVYRSRLEGAGITTFAALAAADAADLSARIDAPASRVQAWIDDARRRRS